MRLRATALSSISHRGRAGASAPAIWTPAALGASLSLWYDASDAATITLNGSTVSQWRDKSGNDRHVSQTTAGVQPAYLANDLNGKAGIDFYLNKGLFSTSNPVVSFVITVIKARNATWDGYHTMLDARTSGPSRIGGLRASGNTGFWLDVYPSMTWDDGVQRTPALSGYNTITSPRIVGFTAASGRGNPMQEVTIGNFSAGTQGGSGVQYEIIATSTAPSTEDRQKLEGYLAWKWGLQANLPIDHPYRWDGTLFGYSRLWTPTNIATALWLDAADAATVTLNGSTVSQWRDKSGNARHVAQATAVKQPTYTLAAQNGLNVLSFDGNSRSLFASSGVIDIPQPFSRFVAGQFLVKANQSILIDSETTNTQCVFYNGETGTSWVVANGVAPTFTSYAYGTRDFLNHQHFHSINGANSYWGIDGSSPTGPVNGGPGGQAGIRVGHVRTELSPSYSFNGRVFELVLVSGVISTSDRQKLEGYLAWKWGTQSTLPADHPYRNGAPTV